MIVYWHCGASIPFKYASRCTFDTHLINPPHSHYDEWLLIQIISTSLATPPPPPPKKKKTLRGPSRQSCHIFEVWRSYDSLLEIHGSKQY